MLLVLFVYLLLGQVNNKKQQEDKKYLMELKFSTLFKTPLSKIPGQRQRAPQPHCVV
jgi:hypothetical protein